jgi:hypothetical protein
MPANASAIQTYSAGSSWRTSPWLPRRPLTNRNGIGGERRDIMIYKGIVKRGPIALGEVILPEGTRVSIIPDESVAIDIHASAITLKE